MTCKEKALELYEKMGINWMDGTSRADLVPNLKIPANNFLRECAIIAAKEVLSHVNMVDDNAAIDYWEKVIEEIKNL